MQIESFPSTGVDASPAISETVGPQSQRAIENAKLHRDFIAGRYAAALLMLRDPETRHYAQQQIEDGLQGRMRAVPAFRESYGPQRRGYSLPRQREAAEEAELQSMPGVPSPFGPMIETAEGRRAITQKLTQRAERIDAAEAGELEYVSRLGHLAFQKLIKNNMGLISTIVLDVKQTYGLTTDMDDLTQKGVLGFARALERFDPKQGTTLAPYSRWFIRQSVLRGEQQEASVLVAHGAREDMRKVSSHNYDGLTDEELARALGISVKSVRSARRAGHDTQTVSLNRLVGDGDKTELGDMIPDETINLEESVANRMHRQALPQAFETVVERIDNQKRRGPKGVGGAQLADYVRMHYGLPPHTGAASLREIAGLYGASPQGVLNGINKFCAILREVLGGDQDL